MTDSQKLLADYVRKGSEAAFSELVSRYIGLVYSAALRVVDSDPQLAEDVTQIVFTDLARTARNLSPNVMLGGWLHRHACFVAAHAMRDKRRRQIRERQAVEMSALKEHTEADLASLSPILDEAVNQLGEEERMAILLRFFEQLDFHSLGQALGSSEDAARMRVNRALEKLHSILKRRGISTSAAALSVVLSAHAIETVPAGLAAEISVGALAGAALHTTAAMTIAKTVAMTTLQKALITTTVAVLAGASIYEAHRATQLREQNQALEQQQAPLTEQIRQLERERDEATNRLAAMWAPNEQSSNGAELLRLRGEVARLKSESQDAVQFKAAQAQKATDPLESAARTLLEREQLLRQGLERMPDKNIPELQYLDATTWARVAQNARLDSDDGIREALSELRQNAKDRLTTEMGMALHKFTEDNNGQLPTDLSQLKPYFKSPVDDASLARYQILKTGSAADLQPGDRVIKERGPVDNDYDHLVEIGLNTRVTYGIGKQAGSAFSTTWSASTHQSDGK